MESAFIHRPAHSVMIDVAPITRHLGEPVELAIGDQVMVNFDDGLGLEAPHKLKGEVIHLYLHNRVAVLIGTTKFAVPAESCEIVSFAKARP